MEAPAGDIQGVAWAELLEGSHWGKPMRDLRAPWGAHGDSSGPAPGLSAAPRSWWHPPEMLWSRVSGAFSSRVPSHSLLQTPSTGGSPAPASPARAPEPWGSPRLGEGTCPAGAGDLELPFAGALCCVLLVFFFGFSTAHFSLANVWEKGVLCYRLNSLRSSSQLVQGGSRWALGS